MTNIRTIKTTKTYNFKVPEVFSDIVEEIKSSDDWFMIGTFLEEEDLNEVFDIVKESLDDSDEFFDDSDIEEFVETLQFSKEIETEEIF